MLSTYLWLSALSAIAQCFLNAAPLAIFGTPIWASFLILVGLLVVELIPIANIIVPIGVWVYALILAINGPQDGVAIYFYIAFGIYVLKALYVLFGDAFKKRRRW